MNFQFAADRFAKVSARTGFIAPMSMKLAGKVKVVLIGSMFKESPTLIETMSATIHAVAPKARLVHLMGPLVVGGVLLGMEQAGVEYSGIRQTLIDTTNAILTTHNQRRSLSKRTNGAD